MRARLRTPNNHRRQRSSVRPRCKGQPAIFLVLMRFGVAVSSGSDSCPIVRIRQGPVTRKGRVNRRQEVVLGRKSHCPQRGPCDGTAGGKGTGRSGHGPRKGQAVRDSGPRKGQAVRDSGPRKGQAVRTAENQRGLREAGRLRACPIVCLIRVNGTPRKELGTLSGEPSGTANGNEGPMPGGAVPSGVSDAPSRRRLDCTIGHACLEGECRWVLRGCPGVRAGMKGHGHGTSERTRVRS